MDQSAGCHHGACSQSSQWSPYLNSRPLPFIMLRPFRKSKKKGKGKGGKGKGGKGKGGKGKGKDKGKDKGSLGSLELTFLWSAIICNLGLRGDADSEEKRSRQGPN